MIFVYYAGYTSVKTQHNGSVYKEAMLNEKRPFPLERSLRFLGQTRGAFLIAMIDDNDDGSQAQLLKVNPDAAQAQNRNYLNMIMTHGFGGEQYFKHLRDIAAP